MKKVEEYKGFEQGPIRPPSEAESLLIRISRNCPWNRCTFCPVYKGTTFSLRPVEHVLRDIDTVKWYVDAILDARRTGSSLENIAPPGQQQDNYAINGAYNFISGGMKSIFLQDGNSLIIKPEDIITILIHLQQSFPMVERITSYARSHTIARIKDIDLKTMKDPGLNRIHIGLESGSNEVLKRVAKGVTQEIHILVERPVAVIVQIVADLGGGIPGRAVVDRVGEQEGADAVLIGAIVGAGELDCLLQTLPALILSKYPLQGPFVCSPCRT